MRLIKAAWGYEKPVTSKGRVEEVTRGSECFVYPHIENGELKKLYIELRGVASHVPALKNNRNPRFPGIDPKVLSRIKAMDQLYKQVIGKSEYRFNSEVFALIGFGHRGGRSFDLDNSLTTVKDWLEPAEKIVGVKSKTKRGWGVGVVENDSQIRAWGYLLTDIGITDQITIIELMSWDIAREEFVNSIARFRQLWGANHATVSN